MFIYLLNNDAICTGPVVLPVIPGMGVQLPGNAVEVSKLLTPSVGKVWVWQDGKPQQMSDQRGPAFRKDTGDAQEWTELGELPEELTLVPPPGPHYFWTQAGWELDEAAENASVRSRSLANRDGLLYEAGLRIAPLQDAVDLNKATAQEEAALARWKEYRIALNRIEDQDGFPSDIEWPVQPEVKKAT
jgi:hypothetical protein